MRLPDTIDTILAKQLTALWRRLFGSSAGRYLISPATIDDARRLFEWRNDDLTRAMSKNTEPVAWEQHIAWLSARLCRDQHGLAIAFLDGRPIGTLRIDGDEISYTVAPNYRRRGHGRGMLIAARQLFGPRRAEIYRRNAASIRIAVEAGFTVHLLDD
jgi:RimJ/RimL family protein N-acetyltransferase